MNIDINYLIDNGYTDEKTTELDNVKNYNYDGTNILTLLIAEKSALSLKGIDRLKSLSNLKISDVRIKDLEEIVKLKSKNKLFIDFLNCSFDKKITLNFDGENTIKRFTIEETYNKESDLEEFTIKNLKSHAINNFENVIILHNLYKLKNVKFIDCDIKLYKFKLCENLLNIDIIGTNIIQQMSLIKLENLIAINCEPLVSKISMENLSKIDIENCNFTNIKEILWQWDNKFSSRFSKTNNSNLLKALTWGKHLKADDDLRGKAAAIDSGLFDFKIN